MNKITLKVPHGVQYISEWSNYEYPFGRCIVDKGVTGCGYTEFCLRNNFDLVLCSPRKLLLENKYEQHKKEGNWNVLYLENDIENFDGVSNFSSKIREHIFKCKGANETGEVRPVKFLITYDSLYHLINFLRSENLIDSFVYVVDEFQSIFLDAFFKASTEFDFVEYLQECSNILYLSATPMLDEYLLDVPEFADLDFYSLDWENSGYVENVKIQRKLIRSISGECLKIIDRYKKEKYPTILDQSGKPIESKEAVFYLNSVSDIIRVIKKAKLTPDEVNIICSDTTENQNKLNKLSRDLGYNSDNGFKVGHVYLKDEINKKFTFCTKSVYMGADFHSTCASSYVFADPNIKCLALDISLDLPQIVGRQRDKNNPFKNNITLFYRVLDKNNIISKELFDELLNKRRESTKNLLDLYNSANSDQKSDYLQKLKDSIKVSKYERDFVSISSKTNSPVYNKFIELADKRAWKVSQKDYQDQISVTKAISDLDYDLLNSIPEEFGLAIQSFIKEFDGTTLFAEKLRIYCEYLDFYFDNKYVTENIKFYVKDPDFQKFYEFYGTTGCKAKKYLRLDLEKGIVDNTEDRQSKLILELDKYFKPSLKYTLKDIKNNLKIIYDELGVSNSPKAVDLKNYYNISEIKLYDSITKKQSKGYLIISKKVI